MAGDEVDARVRQASALLVEVARSREAGGELRDGAAVALPEPPDGVAVLAVPFGPEDGEVADLVPALADVPRLGDELHLGEDGVLVDDVEERAELVDRVEFAGEGAGEVEPEPVDVHLEGPVAEAVHDELEHAGVLHVEGVPAA